ncbi:MAG: protein mraZ [Marinilabiliales bacterium]|nr:MAG: protein mraZ [Marinilabiliales bacterium]
MEKCGGKCFYVGENIYTFTSNYKMHFMFVGEHSGKLDNKGRIIFPAPLKRQIPDEEQQQPMVLKKDIYDKCLILYTMSEWQYQTGILKKKLNPFNKRHAEFLREYYRGTAELHFDSSNRLLIPKKLLEYIGADKELVFAGQKGKIEIWSGESYNAKQISQEDFADLANDILGGDFGFYNED